MSKALQATVTAIAAAVPAEVLKALDAKNLKPVSERTLQFDVPQRADGTNRIKITVEKGGFMVRAYRYEETDVIAGVTAEGLATAIKNIGTI